MAIVDPVADRLADEVGGDGVNGEFVALELVTLLGAVRGLLECPGGVEVVAPAGQFEPLVAELARFPGEIIEGQIGPLAGEQRDRSRHEAAPDDGGLRARRIVTEAPRGGNVAWTAAHRRSSPLRPDHVRITLRISHKPHSVTRRLPVHTATGGTAPNFACDTPSMKTG